MVKAVFIPSIQYQKLIHKISENKQCNILIDSHYADFEGKKRDKTIIIQEIYKRENGNWKRQEVYISTLDNQGE